MIIAMYTYLVERNDDTAPDRRALSGGWAPARRNAPTEAIAIDIAQETRLAHNYFGPLRVSLWPQQADEPHPMARFEPAPAHAETFDYAAVPTRPGA
ncbi:MULTISPECIES: hypothetical protein [Streptomyces]|uniref:Uncharacterized protein n=1 Tax=Streptomyces venezuelae (strain ATCC 10712 / CBS 650.69 / DSM 40230 / JCM 4526 / NBRC 13096 / PD 04745) TaxID=953739 RepID=F2RKZ6_STRVP|nr:hypothetical protein [Streptomyces venezuelae]APE21365.1 hypothetical protein vnz_10260 [Streptomyces venezuelae]QER98754.1 hypothetical protein DEJ43_10390 [Streptomyces venezuelae ATCC 10712]CCA55385.1 hypothetical protein SVEN_2099 [Streptomyces venezuelae ATCC 10712]